MKRILIVTGCVMVSLCIMMCKKSSQKNNATCATCSGAPLSHPSDTSGTFYFLPTAFTPNGDGRNDIYSIFGNNLDTDSSHITIWNMDGKEVFSGKITARWEGTDLNGNTCSAGQYPVYVQLKTRAGATINTCTCVTLLIYSGNCIKTNGVTYYFPDQLDSAGFVFPTNETLCP